MAEIWVYAELNQGRLMPVTLELLTLARGLGEVDVVALGQGARDAVPTLGEHGARRVLHNEDSAFADYLAEPATDCLAAALSAQAQPDLVLFGFSSDSREVAGRLAARLGVGVISNALDVEAADGGYVAKVPYFGGAKVASCKANNKPAVVLVNRTPTHRLASMTTGCGRPIVTNWRPRGSPPTTNGPASGTAPRSRPPGFE